MRVISPARSGLFIFITGLIFLVSGFAFYVKKSFDEFARSEDPNFMSIYALEGISSEVEQYKKADRIALHERIKSLLSIQKNSLNVSGEEAATELLIHYLNELFAKDPIKNYAEIDTIIEKTSTQLRLITRLNRDALEFKLGKYRENFYTSIFIFTIITIFYSLVGFITISRKLRSLDSSLKQLLESLDSASTGGAFQFDGMNFKLLQKISEKIRQLLETVKAEGSLDHVEIKKLHSMLRSIIDSLDYPFAIFDQNGDMISCNKKLDIFLERINKQISNFDGQMAFATKLSSIVTTTKSKSLCEEFNSSFETELKGYRLSVTYALADGDLIAALISFKKKNSGIDEDAIELAIKDALTHLDSIHMSLHAGVEGNLGQLPSKAFEFFSSARNDCFKINSILNNCIDNSALNKEEYNKKIIDIAKIVNNSVKDFNIMAESKSLTIDYIQPPMPIHIEGIAQQISILINNLIDNAVKNSPEEDLVSIKLVKKDGMAIFAINNDGPRIPKQYLDAIFDKYFKVPNKESKGEGLGLYLAKKIVETHGGKIWVESDKKSGTTFWVSLAIKDA